MMQLSPEKSTKLFVEVLQVHHRAVDVEDLDSGAIGCRSHGCAVADDDFLAHATTFTLQRTWAGSNGSIMLVVSAMWRIHCRF
jgi:hypothetical protein